MDATTCFSRLNALMQGNPPAAADAPALARFAAIGVAPGKPFDPKALDPTVASVVERSAKAGQVRLIEEAKKPHGTNINGWDVTPANTANFGTDYMWRAVVAMIRPARRSNPTGYRRRRVRSTCSCGSTGRAKRSLTHLEDAIRGARVVIRSP